MKARAREINPDKTVGSTLATLSLTNGEGAMLESVVHFLNFMRAESAPIPFTKKDLNKLLVRYVWAVRHEELTRISELRVSRGEQPLPNLLLTKYLNPPR